MSTTDFRPDERYLITRSGADRRVKKGEPVWAVYLSTNWCWLFINEDAAFEAADAYGVRALDWETGNYA